MTDTAETRWESHNEAGRRLFSEGDYAAAEREFVAAMREANSLGPDDLRLASSIASLAQIKYLQKDIEQAEALFKRALAIREKQLGEKHPEVAVTINSLARLYFRRNDFVAAAPLLMRLLAIKQEALGAHHPEVAVILTSLAKVRLAERQYEDAEQLARRALVIREEIHEATDPAVATSLDTLADVLAARGHLEEEERLRKRIAAIRASQAPGGHTGERGDPPSATLSSAAREARPATAPAPAAPASPPPPPSAPPSHPRTTRSASLPWIEPPTSPALRRPAPRPFASSGPGAPPPGAPAVEGPAAPPSARSTTSHPGGRSTPRFAAQYAPPAAARPPVGAGRKTAPEPLTGPVRGPLVQSVALPPEEGRVAQRRPSRVPHRHAHEDARVREGRRSPIKLAVAVALLLGCAGGAWLYLSGGRVTSWAGAALDPLSAEGNGDSRADRPADASALTASPDPSYGSNPPERRKPPAAAYSDDPPVNLDQSSSGEPGPDASRAARALAPNSASQSGDTASPLEPEAPAMPSVNVDRITSAIGDNARARADSLGRRTITVKPPDFQKP